MFRYGCCLAADRPAAVGDRVATKKVIRSAGMPKALGPYSHAVRAGELLFVSGQAGADPATGKLAPDFDGQCRQAFANLLTVLRAAGCGPEHVVKTTVFLSDTGNFAAMNAVFAETFPTDPPTRATPTVAFPQGILISIECVAMMP